MYMRHLIPRKLTMSSQPWYNQSDSVGKSSSDAQGGTESSSAGKTAAKGALKVASAAGRGLAKGARAMSTFAANNPWGIRLFSFVASLSLITIACLGLVGIVGTGSESKPASFYLFNVYMLFLAFFLFIAECKDEWAVVGKLRGWVLEQFGFFQSNLGRGVFLVFIGLVWFGAWGWKWGVLGFAVMAVGLLYMLAHWSGSGLASNEDAPAPTSTVVTARAKGRPTSSAAGTKHVELDEDDSDIP